MEYVPGISTKRKFEFEYSHVPELFDTVFPCPVSCMLVQSS